MKKLLLCLLLLIPINLFSNILAYEDVYFLLGDKTNQAKYQISFKYALIYPFDSGIFVAYTQLAKWNIYDKSSPFEEINHNPLIFWEKKDIWLDYLRIAPYSHISNGRDGAESESVESGFIQFQKSWGKKIKIAVEERATLFFVKTQYKRHKGNFRTILSAQLTGKGKYLDQEKIYFGGEWTHKSYWMEAGIMVRFLSKDVQPKVYIQGYYGTAEFLRPFRKKSKALRIGLTFNPI